MGKLVVMNQITINGAFEAPTTDDWLLLDEDSSEASLEQLILADALLLGRKTYEGLAVVWPQLPMIRRWLTSPSGSTRCRSTSRREP